MLFRNWRRKGWTNEAEMKEQAQLESMNYTSDEERLLFAEAKLGMDAKEFWESDAGRYLRGRLIVSYTAALRALIEASPMDADAIAKAQVEAKAAQSLAKYINDAITSGEAAEIQVNTREDDYATN